MKFFIILSVHSFLRKLADSHQNFQSQISLYFFFSKFFEFFVFIFLRILFLQGSSVLERIFYNDFYNLISKQQFKIIFWRRCLLHSIAHYDRYFQLHSARIKSVACYFRSFVNDLWIVYLLIFAFDFQSSDLLSMTLSVSLSDSILL